MHNAKRLANEINKSLDDLGAPNNIRERSVVLSKILNVSKQQAWSLLEGQLMPDEALLQHITSELEIDLSEPNKK